ncbi:glycosyltransferase [bacterium]|nr:MAG: glycosyltransferase [bacterium]
MKIVVASPIPSGSPKAHAINTFKMASGFAKIGHDVTIVAYKGHISVLNQLSDYYGADKSIKWVLLPQNILGRQMNLHSDFTILAIPKLLAIKPDVIYSRAYHLPHFISKIGFNVIAESHAHLDNMQSAFLKMITSTKNKKFLRWVTISNYLKKGYVELGAVEHKIKVLPDAVDLSLFEKPESHLQLFESKKNIVYAGHLYDYKGIPLILEAAQNRPEYNFHLVGGLDDDINRHKSYCSANSIKNVFFHGMKKHSEVPNYLWSADVLILTHTLNHPSANFTSPVKLAEYLAAKRPTLVADIPALKDWLSDKEVFFYKSDDVNSFVEELDDIFDKNGSEIDSVIENAFKLAQRWTYEKRCQQILEGLF